MLVATELKVGDMADDASSDGLPVMLLNRDWNKNGKLWLDPDGPEEYSEPWWWPFAATSLALWLMVEPLRLLMWFSRRKLVLLLDIGELQVVAGCEFDDLIVGDIELCCVTVYGIKL
jgi:hypothetical protein